MSVLSQNPGKLTAREGWRNGKEAAAPQGYLSESPSFINLFIVLVTWPTLLQVVFNQKLRSRKDALSVNTLKKYRNTQFVWHCKKNKSHTVLNWKQKPAGWGENATGRAQLQNGKQDLSKHLAPNQKMEKGEQDAVLEIVLPYFSRIGC